MGTGLLIFIYIGLIRFCGGGIIFKRVIARFIMLVYDAVFYRFGSDVLAYMRTSLPFSIVNWWVGFYIGRGLSLNVLLKAIRCFLKLIF